MSTPIAHSLCGAAIGVGSGKSADWKLLLLIMVAANLPDLDYLPGLLVGRPNVFHHGPTHSVAAAVLVGLAAGVYLHLFNAKPFWRMAGLFAGAYASHLVLDYFTVDTSAPFGEMLFWPFSKAYFMSPVTVFRDIHKGGTNAAFFANVFQLHNLITGLSELAVWTPVVFLARWVRRRGSKKKDGQRMTNV